MNFLNSSYQNDRSIFYWLMILTVMTFLMILIGGLTRLTESGLSMVDWQPILGFLPPLTNDDWIKVFSDYKDSPEFIIKNSQMNLNEFKFIFWWEWFHRFFARCIGLVFIIPMIYFIYKKKISKKLFLNLSILFIFGLFQAVVGWWMVKSGLDQNPYVSSYRLAFHLTNAVIILSILLWMSLNAISILEIKFFPNKSLEYYYFTLIILLLLTIISGAFMAGSHAGQSFNTYPLMNGYFFPNDYFLDDMGVRNFFENTVAINFNHRWLASFVFVLIISNILYLIFSQKYNKYNLQMALIFIFACLQFLLGIMTLLTNVEISLASLHQINSMLLLASLIYMYHSIKKLEK